MHPNFTHYQRDWNIALLKLAEPVTITDYVRTVCVPTADMDSEFSAGTLTTITGWGQTRQGKTFFLFNFLPFSGLSN